MWWSVHQPQWGSPELRHSPQVVYCSQDSTGTRDTCKGEAQPQHICRHGGQAEPGAASPGGAWFKQHKSESQTLN